MAFNLARYDLTSFNIKGGSARYITALGAEEVIASIGSALNIYGLAIGNERIDKSVSGMSVKYIKANGTETIDEVITDAQLSIILKLNFEENVAEQTHLASVVMLSADAVETVSEATDLDAEIYLDANGEENIDANTILSAKIYATAQGYEFVSESASLEIIDERTCFLTTTLYPGQKMIVDASTYNVLIDNENAIEIQSGDWIDELNRETTDITISAAAGATNLSASILYTERYL